jgi:ATP-binding protein involved in chromosome partitioning
VTLSTDSDLKTVLGELPIPGLSQTIGDLGRVIRADVADDKVAVEISLGFPAKRLLPEIEAAVRERIAASGGSDNIELKISSKVSSHAVQKNMKPLKNIKNIIAIASGKGGVGKSTTAVNLALALVDEGASVGILDADIYGPSQPLMLGLSGQRPESDDGETMEPLHAHGLQVMSIGFLVDPDQPMIWRGPMVTSALNQLLQQTNWDDLDYLIVDMPPGTGDIQLTLSQQVPVSGAVIVTTPQDIALLDARRGLQMFRKVAVPILGVVENMSTHVCSSCGHEEAIFGAGGGQAMADDFELELLGQLPLDASIREQTDSGTPTVVSAPDSPQAEAYRHAARRMAVRMALQNKDFSHRFAPIVVEGVG